MIAVNYTQFRKEMKKYLDMVTDSYEMVTVTRKDNKNAVILSEEAVNNLFENLYVMSSKANYDWVAESKAQLEQGRTVNRELIGEGNE